jgi:hypothetical protein
MDGKLPEHAKTFASADDLYRHLQHYHGITPEIASERLHLIKQKEGYHAADNVIFDYTGNLFDPATREWIGSLTEGGAK